jgi:phosphate transport system permease protein
VTIDLRFSEPIVYEAIDPADDEMITITHTSRDEVVTWLAAAVAALAATWLVYERLTPLSGGFGFLVFWWAMFNLISWYVARVQWGVVRAHDHLVRVWITSAALIALVPLVAVIVSIVTKGYHALSWGFLTRDMGSTSSSSPISQGGVGHAILGTLEIVGLATLISVPLGVITAVYLNEVGGRMARPVRLLTDAMSAVPSIVCGLFIYATLIQPGIVHLSGWAGSLALSILMLPTVTRTTEVVLRLVPGGLREASYALGASDWRTTRSVVLPTARSGLVTSAILGVARVIGETAPLLLTIFGAFTLAGNPFSDRQEALPHFIYGQYQQSQGPGTPADLRMWSAALVLLFLVLFVFVTARFPASRGYVFAGTATTLVCLWRLESVTAAVAIPVAVILIVASAVAVAFAKRAWRRSHSPKGALT